MSTCLYRNQDNRIIFKLFFLLKKLFAFTIKYSTRSNEIYGSQLLFRYGNAATLKWNMQTKNQKTAKNVKKVKNIYILPCFHWGFDYEVILHWNRRGPFSTKSPSLCRWSEKERGAGQQAAHLSFHIWRETRKRGGIGRVVHKFSLFWGNLMALQLFFLRELELIWGTNGCMTIHKQFALQ